MAYTIEQAREQLGGVSVSTIYRWLEDEKLGSLKVGGRRFITHSQLVEFLEQHEEAECSSS